MHVAVDLNLNWFLQFIVTAFIVALGLHRLVKNTASKYFVVDATFDSSSSSSSSSSDDRFSINNNHIISNNNNMSNKEKNTTEAVELCPVCSNSAPKRCSRCRTVSYCSEACQRSHWNSEHKTKCKNLKSLGKADSKQSSATWRAKKASAGISLVPSTGTSNVLNQSKKILFPYEEFVELFNWDKPGFPPCGLLNCGNSCFANVVLQCLTYTKPLVAYLLEKGHRRECRRNDWCFLCEFQTHLEKASQSLHPFSPISILSRLQNIGGNLGYGSQEDAHELMRFAIDTMQSVCLDEFGGEKAVHPSSQETTLIQHIFGGHLQSQVICTKCNSISNQLENMMDLTVEIQGDAASLEECLDQFTAKESLHGENLYKCDRCNDYVTAWKRLTIQSPPNILTIALKRFQSGRFGKLNKKVTFPETLDLSPYMSKAADDGDFYKLYAVIVHVDMLNASFFGHYICYIKDFRGNWYRVDDCKVARVDLYDVLSQGAYMLLYSRAQPRPTCLYPFEPRNEVIQKNEGETEELQCTSPVECHDSAVDSCALPSTKCSVTKTTLPEEEFSCVRSSEDVKQNIEIIDSGASSSVLKDVLFSEDRSCVTDETAAAALAPCNEVLSGDASLTRTNSKEADVVQVESTSSISDVEDETGRTKTKTSNCNGYSTMKDTCGMPSDISPSLSEPGHSLPSSGGTVDAVRKSEGTGCSGLKLKPGHSLPSSGGTVDAVRKSEGTGCSGPKLKPLFPAGFLGKRTRNKPVTKNLDVLEKNCERASGTSSCGPSSGFANTNTCYQNGVITDEKKPYIEHKDESSTNMLSKQAEMLHHTTQMGFSESDEAIDLHIGNSSGPEASSEKIDISVAEKRERVAEENLALNGRSDKDLSLSSQS